MKRKLSVLLLTLCLTLTLLPRAASAAPTSILYVGDTWVSSSSDDEDNVIHYWVEDTDNSSGHAYEEGTESDYAFSVWHDGDEYYLTLNGVDITSEYFYSGIYCTGDLNIVLAASTQNSIGSNEAPNNGIFIAGDYDTLSVNGCGSLTVFAFSRGLSAHGSISIGNGTNLTVYAYGEGISSNQYIRINGLANVQIEMQGDDAEPYGDNYGIYITGVSGNLFIENATLRIEKHGGWGDAVFASRDISISGNTEMELIDWSTGYEIGDCGLHADRNIYIGGNAQISIWSRDIGIYAGDSVYIGYGWDENANDYISSGSPTVTINDMSHEAIQTARTNGFYLGRTGILAARTYGTSLGDIRIVGGSVTSFGSEQALSFIEGALYLPEAYRHKSNTEASIPAGAYTHSAASAYINSTNHKYLAIAPLQEQIPTPVYNQPPENEPTGIPQTGDGTGYLGFLLCGVAAGVAGALLCHKKKQG